MSDPRIAIEDVLLHEGLLSDHPADPGGITNYGISLRYLQGLKGRLHDALEYGDIDKDGDIDADDIRLMRREDAGRIYHDLWWKKYGYERIDDQLIANKMMSLSVNMGSARACLVLQRALRSVHREVKHDGLFGPVTARNANHADADALIAAFRSEAAGYYRSINNPSFIAGWLNRAYA